MQIVEYLKNLDIRLLVALIGFVGVLIGAFISCFTTFCLDWIKFNREEKIYYKRKRENAIFKSINFLIELTANLSTMKQNKKVPDEKRIVYNSLLSELTLYANKKIELLFCELVLELIHDVENSTNNFEYKKVYKYTKIAKKNLGIED